jgi:GNAT superfamily N-acetyltransferase
MKNDLHQKPFGLLEDVYIDPKYRGKGRGTSLVQFIINRAKEMGCYKIIATSRHSRKKVHQFYENLNFKNQGIEFRIDFD